MAAKSAGATGCDKSTSPISAAKLGVTGQTVMAMGVASQTADFAGLNHNGRGRAIVSRSYFIGENAAGR